MNPDELKTLLESVKNNVTEITDAMERLRQLPFEDLGYAKIDHHRALRTGFPEVVLCEGKSIEHIRGILANMKERTGRVLLTRASQDVFDSLSKDHPDLRYQEEARVMMLGSPVPIPGADICVVSAGTADAPVAQEAAFTSEFCGCNVTRVFDAGVAGLHRTLSHVPVLQKSVCVVVVAGMEGALASVVGGLVDCPVLAVPTSVGYGSHFGGMVPLLAMLNSCASNVSVVNIDNGFGAGYMSAVIARQCSRNKM
jgi:NCAIR mutase (PurE)-related protein